MTRGTIDLFVWGYQQHFRIDVERRMNNVMKEFGVLEAGAECMLVGARIPGSTNPNKVCVEPEVGKWPIALFNGLLEAIEEEVEAHPLQRVYFGDEPSMRDKPENIRRDAVRKAVQKALGPGDSTRGVRSFAGPSARVDEYYVVPVLQFPAAIFERYRWLREPVSDGHVTGHPSLIHAGVSHVLSEAYDELQRPDPGRFLSGRSRSPEEVARRAAATFMRTLSLNIGDRNYPGPDLFERFNLISSLMYEGLEGTGRMLLAKPESGAVDVLLRLAEPVPFSEPRWARKVLQMASSDTALIADCEKVLGLGNIADGIDPWATQNLFEIEFIDHYHWRLSCGSEVMLVSRYGVPSLPEEAFPRDRIVDTYQRLFPRADAADVGSFVALLEEAAALRHGSMLVVADDAEAEAHRLSGQGTQIEPTRLTPELYRRVSGIDGTVIVDPHCVCHAIGVILDGPARPECTPSRGSRYNSGIRYVGATDVHRLAVVVSDDRTVDVIPILRPRMKRTAIEEAIAELGRRSREDYHPAIIWLDRHRFYLRQDQCDRINEALAKIRKEPREVGEIMIQWRKFVPELGLDDSYFEED